MATLEQIINSPDPVLIDFYDTGLPSKALMPIVTQVKEVLGGRIKVIKLNIEHNVALAKTYQISNVPTMMLFQNGKQLWRKSGLCSTIEILLKILEKSNQTISLQ